MSAGTATVDREAPRQRDPPQAAPAQGPRDLFRFLLRQLTEMRTAFGAAGQPWPLRAVPGSLLPQRSVAPIRVKDFLAAHPRIGPLYDVLGLFAIYTSPWFSAIYLLLLVSLIGCILPRILSYGRALRSPPPRTPRNLGGCPSSSEPICPTRMTPYSTGRPTCYDGAATASAATRTRSRPNADTRGRPATWRST